MSTIIDLITEKPVTFYFTVITFGASFFMTVAKWDTSYYFFIPPLFLAGQWWRVFTTPFVCTGGIGTIISIGFIVYFGLQLERRVNSINYLKALIFGYGLIVLSLIILSFISILPSAFVPIMVGPNALILFLLELLVHVSPNNSIYMFFDIPIAIVPIIALLIFICLYPIVTSLLLGLIYGYIFPDLFPNIIKKEPNNAQNMDYKSAGYWVKKPSKKNKGGFSGKPHVLNE